MKHTIVAIGSSAGGLEALQEFLSHFPNYIKDFSIIIAQHLSPTNKSLLVEILGRETKLQVIEATNGIKPDTDTVYITPPDTDILFINNQITLRKPSNPNGPKPSVDVLFESLAESTGFNIIAVILSGTGNDGAAGIKAIKKAGGFIIVQEPSTAKFDGMPTAAIQAGVADIVTGPSEMGIGIYNYLTSPFKDIETETESVELNNKSLHQIFALLSKRTGTNFQNYKPTTIYRRINKRLQKLSIDSIDEYLNYIKAHPGEIDDLFNNILIGVTHFFRDTEAFQALGNNLLEIIARKKENDAIRVWVAGCATGEEAYSIAILLSKLIYHSGKAINIQIFATDIDEKAISIARRGIYPITAVENIEKGLSDTYFTHRGNFVEVNKSIRSLVLFCRHDITSNPPFLRLDLISCRNLLIYFGIELQKQIIPLFHYALLVDSYLFLGQSETVGSYGNLFSTVDGKNKIFQRKIGNNSSYVNFEGLKGMKQGQLNFVATIPKTLPNLSLKEMVKETLFATFDQPYVVINGTFDIQEVSGDIRPYLTLPNGSVNVNILKLIHPELLIEFRSLLTQCLKNRGTAVGKPKRFTVFEKPFMVRLSIRPIIFQEGSPEMNLVVFEPIPLDEIPDENGKQHIDNDQNERILDLELELSATKEHLQAYIEEIETSNEELQSLNEEMQSTNEELQSANEELEIKNEELESTNEEIQVTYTELKSANEELEKKEKELQKANSLFQALIDNTQQGNILLASNFEITYINQKALSLLREIGMVAKETPLKNILEIIPDTLLQDFVPFIREAIVSKKELRKVFHIQSTLKSIIIEFCSTPVKNEQQTENAYINLGMLDLTEIYESQSDLFLKDEMLFSLLESNTTYLIRVDLQGNYTYVNKAFCQKFGYSPEELLGKHYLISVHHDDCKICEEAIVKLFENPGSIEVVEMRKPNPTGGYFLTSWEFVPIHNKEGAVIEIQCMGRDITEQRNTETLYKNERDHLEMIVESGKLGTWDWDIQSGNMAFNKEWAALLGFDNKGIMLQYDEWKKLIHPEDVDSFLEVLEKSIKGNNDYYSAEHRKIAKDGTIKWIKATGKVFGRNKEGIALRILGIHEDITENKQAQEKARLNEERNSAILETMQEGIVMQNLQGEILSCNKSAVRILGISYEQMVGLKSIDPVWNCIKETGEPFPGEEHPAMEALSTGKSISGVIMGINKPDGSLTWISINAQLLYKPGSMEAYGVFTSFVDISTRKNAQLQVKKSEELLRASMNASLEALYLLEVLKDDNNELIDFTLQEVNKVGLNQLKKTKEEVIGLPIRKIFYLNDTHGFDKFKKVYLLQVPEFHEYCNLEEEGKSQRYFYQQIFPLENGVAVYNRDITEKLQAEQERTVLLNRLENVVEQSPGMIYEYCLKPDGRSYLPFCSNKIIDFFGITPKEAEQDATRIFTSIHHVDIEKVRESILVSATEQTEWRIDFRINHPDGKMIWVEGSSRPEKLDNGDILWRGILHNITDRKKLEADLERLSLLAKRTTNAVLFADADRRTVWVNEGFTRLTGYTLEDMVGKKPGELLQFNKTNKAAIELMREKLHKEEPLVVEILNITKHGKEYWVSLEIQPLFDKGKLIGFISIEIDITDRKLKEEEQNKLISQLTLTIDDLTQFSYIVSHNLRAPLANVLGLTHFLKNNPEDENKGEFLNMLEESAINLDNVIKDLNELLALRNKPFDYELVSLADIFSDCLDLLGHNIEQTGAKIEAEFNGLDMVYSVKPILLSIFYNLISNGIKYAKENSVPEIKIAICEDDNNIVFQFADNGIGIDLKRHRNHIFGLYQRLNNIKEGKGIGLYLTKSNTKRLGGTITVESEHGIGTTFTVSLPNKNIEH